MFKKLEAIHNSGNSNILINWHYEEDDEDMLEAGEDYHDHHHSKNVGNISGKMQIWDLLFNTNKDYYTGSAKLGKKPSWLKKEI